VSLLVAVQVAALCVSLVALGAAVGPMWAVVVGGVVVAALVELWSNR
jgi:hypothetical protein